MDSQSDLFYNSRLFGTWKLEHVPTMRTLTPVAVTLYMLLLLRWIGISIIRLLFRYNQSWLQYPTNKVPRDSIHCKRYFAKRTWKVDNFDNPAIESDSLTVVIIFITNFIFFIGKERKWLILGKDQQFFDWDCHSASSVFVRDRDIYMWSCWHQAFKKGH